MKLERHSKIIELIGKYEIDTQEELAIRLKDAGFNVTQATVSRDIRELKLYKKALDGGRQKYAIIQEDSELSDKYTRILSDALTFMDAAQNILVIKTASGMAMAAAAALDAMQLNEIVGCIAGDDTIFCVVRSAADAISTMEKIKKVLPK